MPDSAFSFVNFFMTEVITLSAQCLSFKELGMNFYLIFSEPYTAYQLRVRAETGGGYSEYSDQYPALTDVDSKYILTLH